jgi:hypothetical protein
LSLPVIPNISLPLTLQRKLDQMGWVTPERISRSHVAQISDLRGRNRLFVNVCLKKSPLRDAANSRKSLGVQGEVLSLALALSASKGSVLPARTL